MPKSIPTLGDSNWGTPLNAHLSQLQNSINGGINSFEQFSGRPTNLTADDAGKTYLYTQTGNLHHWTGTAWKVLNESVINVKDYGAIGDGVTDDTAAIQQLLNFGGAIYIPSGKYFCRNTLNIIKSNTKLYGDYANTLLIGNVAKSLIVGAGTKITTGSITQKVASYLDSITLENLSFVSKHIFDDTVTLVAMGYIKNSQVKNCIFNGITQDSTLTASTLHGIHFSGFYNCKFLTNIFYGPGPIESNTSCYGFSGLNDGSIAENGFSSGNICYDSTDTGMGLWTGCKNITVVGDTFNMT